MAGIVASTLRRKAFHKRTGHDSRFPVYEPGHIHVSPTDSRGSSPTRADAVGSSRVGKASRLCHKDFWPTCSNPSEPDVSQLDFDTFDTLVPKANAWLLEASSGLQLIKCETIERKVTSYGDVVADNVLFVPKDGQAIYVKGLRLWYVTASARKAADAAEQQNSSVPVEIGYMNVIPKCLDSSGKYPVYENLPETYAAINSYLADNPLEGKIVTIETVALKLPRKQWKCHDINPDQTCYADDYMRHVLYITRIYFRYGSPDPELIGAQDFLPDYEQVPHWHSVYSVYPRYSPLFTAMRKAKEWMHNARNIAVTNIQTLPSIYRRRPANFHTGVNFIEKSECGAMVRFVRVTYVRRGLDDSSETPSTAATSDYMPPKGFSYKTFVPSPIKVAMCSGAPVYESFASTWERARVWLRLVDRGVVGVETFYHPLNRIWHDQDGGESTVLAGEWTSTGRSDRYHKQRRPLVAIVRVYLDGDYQEPSTYMLPPPPMVEEINDCKCLIM